MVHRWRNSYNWRRIIGGGAVLPEIATVVAGFLMGWFSGVGFAHVLIKAEDRQVSNTGFKKKVNKGIHPIEYK